MVIYFAYFVLIMLNVHNIIQINFTRIKMIISPTCITLFISKLIKVCSKRTCTSDIITYKFKHTRIQFVERPARKYPCALSVDALNDALNTFKTFISLSPSNEMNLNSNKNLNEHFPYVLAFKH